LFTPMSIYGCLPLTNVHKSILVLFVHWILSPLAPFTIVCIIYFRLFGIEEKVGLPLHPYHYSQG
jgi:hypothetical protein